MPRLRSRETNTWAWQPHSSNCRTGWPAASIFRRNYRRSAHDAARRSRQGARRTSGARRNTSAWVSSRRNGSPIRSPQNYDLNQEFRGLGAELARPRIRPDCPLSAHSQLLQRDLRKRWQSKSRVLASRRIPDRFLYPAEGDLKTGGATGPLPPPSLFIRCLRRTVQSGKVS
jgi:hypothetical protein